VAPITSIVAGSAAFGPLFTMPPRSRANNRPPYQERGQRLPDCDQRSELDRRKSGAPDTSPIAASDGVSDPHSGNRVVVDPISILDRHCGPALSGAA